MTWEMPRLDGLSELVSGIPSEESLSRQSREQLAEAMEKNRIGADVEIVVRHAAAGPALVAESAVSDLLVVGRTGQGLGRAAQLILGSVARYCLYYAPGHVAVVPRSAHWNPGSIAAVGVDGSPNSIDALRWAIENLPASTAIRAVHAHTRTLNDATHGPSSFGKVVVAAEGELQSAIETAIASGQVVRSNIAAQVEVGSARDVLLRPELGADLIVVGTHGRAGIAAKVLGSVADHVARHAGCPVVTIRPERSDEAAEARQTEGG